MPTTSDPLTSVNSSWNPPLLLQEWQDFFFHCFVEFRNGVGFEPHGYATSEHKTSPFSFLVAT
jgi:hypothetical protein